MVAVDALRQRIQLFPRRTQVRPVGLTELLGKGTKRTRSGLIPLQDFPARLPLRRVQRKSSFHRLVHEVNFMRRGIRDPQVRGNEIYFMEKADRVGMPLANLLIKNAELPRCRISASSVHSSRLHCGADKRVQKEAASGTQSSSSCKDVAAFQRVNAGAYRVLSDDFRFGFVYCPLSQSEPAGRYSVSSEQASGFKSRQCLPLCFQPVHSAEIQSDPRLRSTPLRGILLPEEDCHDQSLRS